MAYFLLNTQGIVADDPDTVSEHVAPDAHCLPVFV
jgi:hypothetical protein